MKVSSKEIIINKLYGDKIYTIDPFLDQDECLAWINLAEKKGFKDSPPSGGGHGRTDGETPRTSQFSVIDDPPAATNLWLKVKNHLPKDLVHIDKMAYIPDDIEAKKWYPIGVNPHLRIYKYDPGQRIPKHMDYRMARNVWKNGKKYRQMTFTTLLIYLNDNFDQGETAYWLDFDKGNLGSNRKRYCNFVNECGKINDDHDIIIKPKEGMALLTDHCIFHEGLPPVNGTKYVIRTDIIHEKEIEIHQKIQKTLTVKETTDREEAWERIFETSCKNYAD